MRHLRQRRRPGPARLQSQQGARPAVRRFSAGLQRTDRHPAPRPGDRRGHSRTASSWSGRSARRATHALSMSRSRRSRARSPATHLLLELADTTQRQRISRENDLLARLDGSRLMIRQLAHEIKNPLGGLRGAAQLLERELQEAGAEGIHARHHRRGRPPHRAGRLHGGPEPRPAESAHQRARDLRARLSPAARRGARAVIVIERDYDPSLPNAMLGSASDDPGAVECRAQRPAGDRRRQRHGIMLRTRALSNVSIGPARHRLVASVEVEDNGPGVPEELRSSIFYPLVTGRANGTGLGLAVAQELVTRNGGLIEFESEPGRTDLHTAYCHSEKPHERPELCASGSSTTMPPSAGCWNAPCATAAWRRARSRPRSRRWMRCAASPRMC